MGPNYPTPTDYDKATEPTRTVMDRLFAELRNFCQYPDDEAVQFTFTMGQWRELARRL